MSKTKTLLIRAAWISALTVGAAMVLPLDPTESLELAALVAVGAAAGIYTEDMVMKMLRM